jgi:hypothetical protein
MKIHFKDASGYTRECRQVFESKLDLGKYVAEELRKAQAQEWENPDENSAIFFGIRIFMHEIMQMVQDFKYEIILPVELQVNEQKEFVYPRAGYSNTDIFSPVRDEIDKMTEDIIRTKQPITLILMDGVELLRVFLYTPRTGMTLEEAYDITFDRGTVDYHYKSLPIVKKALEYCALNIIQARYDQLEEAMSALKKVL